MSTAASALHNEPAWRSEAGKLLVKRCNACHSIYHYPRPMCPFCMSEDTTFIETKGRATIYSFSITRQKNADPYVIAFVELHEGPRLMTNIIDVPLERLAIGLPVSVVFREVDGRSVPMFTSTTGQ